MDHWHKSSFSSGGDNCVEIMELHNGVRAVRNSRHPDGDVLAFTAGEWEAFVNGVKAGEFG